MKRAESKIFVRSTSTDNPELCTEIAIRGNGFEAPADIGGRSLVGRFPLDEQGSDRLLANHIVIGSIFRANCGYDVNPGKVGAALVGERSCIVDPLLSFGCRVDEDPNAFQSHGILSYRQFLTSVSLSRTSACRHR